MRPVASLRRVDRPGPYRTALAPGRVHYRALLNNQEGLALPLALLVLVVLALLITALAETTVAELEVQLRTRWDTQALYLAVAGVEHQLYAFKADRDAGAVGSVLVPAGGPHRYTVTCTCVLNCSATRCPIAPGALDTTPGTRRWELLSTGEVRRQEPDGTFTVLQDRAVRALVEVVYAGPGPARAPDQVTILRWEEVYP